MDMWGHMGDFALGGMGMGLGMFLFWGVLLAIIVILAVKALDANARRKREKEPSALDILKERYARGEIERDEFEQKKRDLEAT